MECFGGAQETSHTKKDREREKIAKEGAVRALKAMRAAFLPEMCDAIDVRASQVIGQLQTDLVEHGTEERPLHRDSDRVHAQRLHHSHHAI